MFLILQKGGSTIEHWRLIEYSMLSGGAGSSIVLWDLEATENTAKSLVHRPAGAVPTYETLTICS